MRARRPPSYPFLLCLLVASAVELPRRTVYWPGWYPPEKQSYCRSDFPGCCPINPKRILFIHQPKASGTTVRFQLMSMWQQNTGQVACADDPKGVKYYEDYLAGADGQALSVTASPWSYFVAMIHCRWRGSCAPGFPDRAGVRVLQRRVDPYRREPRRRAPDSPARRDPCRLEHARAFCAPRLGVCARSGGRACA